MLSEFDLGVNTEVNEKPKLLNKKGGPASDGWPSGESTCLPPMWPGFDFRTRCHKWIEFVGPLLCHERFFPGYSGFPLSSKTKI